jgi:hypothetical protein
MQGNLTLVAVGAIALGLLACFAGYRTFRVILGITGFVIGGVLAGYLLYNLTHSELVGVIAGLIGGLIGAGLMAGLYVVGVFVIGAIFGGIAASALLALGGSTPPGWLVVILAIIAGVLAILFQKLMIVIATSFVGAWLAVSGVAAIAGVIELPRLEWFPLGLSSAPTGWLLGWLILGFVGFVAQHRSAR